MDERSERVIVSRADRLLHAANESIHRGGVPQANGTVKGGRYIVPRDAFIRWYASAGLDDGLLAQLYGGDAA